MQNTTTATPANITPAPLTVSATGMNKVYDGTTSAAVVLSDNHLGGDALIHNFTSASFSDKNVGNGKPVAVSDISTSGADAGNFSLQNTTVSTLANIALALLTVTPDNATKLFATPNPSFT